MRIILDKSCIENHNIHFVFDNFFFENRVIYEVIWKNGIELAVPQMKVWPMRLSCWIPKAADTHRQCVIFIEFWLQQWLHKCTSVFRYTYVASLVDIDLIIYLEDNF
jgi:hypothetical protein